MFGFDKNDIMLPKAAFVWSEIQYNIEFSVFSVTWAFRNLLTPKFGLCSNPILIISAELNVNRYLSTCWSEVRRKPFAIFSWRERALTEDNILWTGFSRFVTCQVWMKPQWAVHHFKTRQAFKCPYLIVLHLLNPQNTLKYKLKIKINHFHLAGNDNI